MKEPESSERRLFVRLSSDIPVHYSLTPAKKGEERKLSFLSNISVGGILFESSDRIPTGSKFKFKVFLHSSMVPLSGSAEAMWVKEKESAYEIGSRFLAIDGDGRDRLISHIEYELQELIAEQHSVSKLLETPAVSKPHEREEILPFLERLEQNMLTLKSFMKEKNKKDSSNYLSLQADIARQTGAAVEILRSSPMFIPVACFTNRITYILTQIGSWRNLLALTSEQEEELEMDFSDSFKLLEEIKKQI